ncbi:hypothetical protein GCM10027285_26840 [Oleiagrimonas citrea]|uniref:Flagellar assembly protein FliH/Type III secretion system HrpE domain-containing protein n=1 Tax=Oleiagrimonas citrea TaxID=1665687 RepID=A0A846ZLF8_9GAMM|nr:FliH/SctL family protein [Oleiagrimonas citrea]NKZ39024.1 hypothetical protein [Oleiagrimonas citrea]
MIRKVAASRVEFGEAPRELARDGGPRVVPTEPLQPVEYDAAETEAYRAAYLEGFDAGYADGDKEARGKLEAAEQACREEQAALEEVRTQWREALSNSSAQFEAAHESVFADAEALAVEIAFTALCRILGNMQKKRAVVERMCRKLIAERNLSSPRVCVSREDFPELPEADDGIEWEIDSTLGPGECVVRTAKGDVEASLQSQLASIMQALLATLKPRGVGA